MGLAFLSGFATGLSKGLDDFNKMETERQKLRSAEATKASKLIREQKEKSIKFGQDTAEAWGKLSERESEIRADENLTKEAKIEALNGVRTEKKMLFLGSAESASEMGYNVPLTELDSKEYTGFTTIKDASTEKVYTVNGDREILQQGLDNGTLRFKDGTIQSRIMRLGQGGQPTPAVNNPSDDNGWETSAEFTSENLDSMFTRPSADLKTTSIGIQDMMSPAELEFYQSQGTDPQKITLGTLTAYRKKVAEQKIKSIAGGQIVDEMVTFFDDNYDNENGIGFDSDLSNKQLATAMKIQSPELGTKDKARLVEAKAKLGISKELSKVSQKVKDENIDFGAVSSAALEVQKKTGENWAESLNNLGTKISEAVGNKKSAAEVNKAKAEYEKEYQKVLKRVGVDTKIQNAIAEYVKIISGAAVTDEERKNFYNIIMGGQYTTTESMLTALDSFVETIEDGYKSTYESIKYESPKDYALGIKNYQTSTEWKKKKKTTTNSTNFSSAFR